MEYNYNDFMAKCPLIVKDFLLDAFKLFHQLVVKLGNRNNTDFLLKQSLLLSSVIHRYCFITNPFGEKISDLIYNYYDVYDIKNPCTEQEGKLAYQIFSYNFNELIGNEKITLDILTIELIIFNVLKDNDIKTLLKSFEINNIPSTHYEVIFTKAYDAYIFKKYIINEKQNKNTIEKKKDSNSLTEYGTYLTAKSYKYNPAVGREQELKKLKVDLLKSKSIILIGEAGVGKTALIEGLAYDLIIGNVPNYLKNIKILKVDIHDLIAGTKYRGDFEEKAKKLITALKNNPNVIAYIEEIHSIKGMGDSISTSFDLMNILKPYLSSGEIKIIGDTTIHEYDKFIALDSAFSRRFIVETITEPAVEILKKIIKTKITEFEEHYNLIFDFNIVEQNLILKSLINLTDSKKQAYYSTRKNPDFVIDVLENIFALAAYHNRENVSFEDIFEGMLMTQDVSESYKKRIIQGLQTALQVNKITGQARVLKFPSRIP